jgi:Tfp pilus assembly protein PilO
MGRSKTAAWVAGTLVLALVLVAGAWFLLIQPLMTETTEMQDQAEAEWLRVDQLEITLAGLKRDFENIDELRAELAGLEAQLPGSIEITDVVRQLNAQATEAGIIITGSATTTAVDVTPAEEAPAAPPADGETTDEGGDTSDDGAIADSAGGAAAPPPTTTAYLYAVPIELTTLGSYEGTLAFLERLQESERIVVVGKVQMTALDPAPAEGGRPAVLAGFVESRLTTWVFVLLSPDGGVEVVEPPEGDDTPQLPAPSGEKNPFLP